MPSFEERLRAAIADREAQEALHAQEEEASNGRLEAIRKRRAELQAEMDRDKAAWEAEQAQDWRLRTPTAPSPAPTPTIPERRQVAGPEVAEAPRMPATPAPAGAQPGPAIGDVPGMALGNLGSSAMQYGKDIWDAVSDPIGTGTALVEALAGGGQLLKDELGVKSMGTFGDQRDKARAVGQHFTDRYGSWDAIKRTAGEDPVGFLADATAPLTLGGAALGRGAGVAGKVASLADPAVAAIEAGKAIGRGAGAIPKAALGMTTGAGSKAVGTAFRSGVQGGDLGRRFRQAMRGEVPMDEVVNEARAALTGLYEQRGRQYRENMKAVEGDPTVLDFDKLDKAMGDSAKVKTFKGVPISQSTNQVRNQIGDTLEQWRKLDPAEYHTVEGFDALKQSLGDILDNTTYGTPEWRVANQAYQAAKDTITEQAPNYAKAMKDYSKATELVREIEKEFSLGKKANAATALRKLQAIIRDDVSSAYGRRAELAAELERGGLRGIEETLSGHAMSSVLPRGLRGAVSTAAAAGGGLAGGASPMLLPALLAGSPRLVGEAAHAAGRAMAPASPMMNGASKAAAVLPRATALAYQLSRPRRAEEEFGIMP